MNYEFYLGNVLSTHVGYSNDKEIRSHASSGGIVSAILVHLLETKRIDGALVSKIVSTNGKLGSETVIATSKKEIIDHAGSSYVDIPIVNGIEMVKKFNGRIALVNVPCYITAWDKMCRNNIELDNKTICKIGLFCGGNVKFNLYRMVLRQHNIPEENVSGIFFRRSYIKGNMVVSLKSGSEIEIPFHHFNVYRILGYHRKLYCIQCDDHTSENADISIGDAFFGAYNKQAIKYSLSICRTNSGESIFREMIENDKIYSEELDPQQLFHELKKTLLFRKNLSTRRLAGKILGINIKQRYRMRIRWNHLVASFLILFNILLQKNRILSRMLYKIPRPLLYIEVLIYKFFIQL